MRPTGGEVVRTGAVTPVPPLLSGAGDAPGWADRKAEQKDSILVSGAYHTPEYKRRFGEVGSTLDFLDQI